MVANRPVAAPDGLGRYAVKVVVTLALVGAALALFRWVHVLMLAFGAVLVAVLLRALAAPIGRHTRLGEAWSVGAAVLAILLLIGGMIAFAGQQISAQLFQLQEYLPRAWSTAERGVMSLPGGPWVVSHVQQASNLSMGGLGPLAHRIGQFAGGSVQAAAEVIVVAVAGIYFAAQPRLYSDGLLGLLPPAARDRVAAASQDIAQALRRWLMGTGLAMLAMGVLVAIGASLLGLPAPLALGLISGLAEFVPVVGAAVAAVP
ncbi:MAG: hypothetical protein JWO33_1912, partial [Caulobacteraceae bacterium]|nr:hypothetical protein [Caulobacteraceae bacterium]